MKVTAVVATAPQDNDDDDDDGTTPPMFQFVAPDSELGHHSGAHNPFPRTQLRPAARNFQGRPNDSVSLPGKL